MNPCPNFVSFHRCVNIPGSFECYCYHGYVLNNTDGVSCDNINECLWANGGCDQICIDQEPSFECRCKVGIL